MRVSGTVNGAVSGTLSGTLSGAVSGTLSGAVRQLSPARISCESLVVLLQLDAQVSAWDEVHVQQEHERRGGLIESTIPAAPNRTVNTAAMAGQ